MALLARAAATRLSWRLRARLPIGFAQQYGLPAPHWV